MFTLVLMLHFVEGSETIQSDKYPMVEEIRKGGQILKFSWHCVHIPTLIQLRIVQQEVKL